MRYSSMRIFLICALSSANASQAASNVSARFDGVYSGWAIQTPGMSLPSCSPFQITRMTIAQGFLRSDEGIDQPITTGLITGLITEEGYMAGFMARPGGVKHDLDGRLENDIISAGFIETETSCAWLVELSRPPKSTTLAPLPIDPGH